MLDRIRYIFQIPLEWFRRVDARVFGDHPGPGVKFEPASDGSRAIMVDYDVLDDRYGGSRAGQAYFPGSITSGRVVLTSGTDGALVCSVEGKNVTSKNVVTGVSWNGTQLIATNEKWTFTNGILTGVTSAANTTINTVTY